MGLRYNGSRSQFVWPTVSASRAFEDLVTVDRIKELVAEMNAQEAKFHPNEE